MALRVGILGVLAVVVFCALFFRLWALQVISGERYLENANNNQIRSFGVVAPRGSIVDRDGDMLVSNKPGTQVQIWPAALEKLPVDEREAMLRRLARLLGLKVPAVRDEGGGAPGERPAHAGHDRHERGRAQDRLPDGAPGRVPGRPDHRDLPAELRAGRPGPAHPRLRGRDRRRAARGEGRPGLPGRRPHREDGDRGRLRHLPARRARRGARLRGRARPDHERARVQPAARAGRQHPADDRRRSPARRRGGARVRDPPRARPGRMGGGRRRDRRPGREHRRDPRPRVEPDLRPERLRRAASRRRS